MKVFWAVSLRHHAHVHETREGSPEEAEHTAIRVSVQVACIVEVKRGSLSSVLIRFFFSEEVLHTGTVTIRERVSTAESRIGSEGSGTCRRF